MNTDTASKAHPIQLFAFPTSPYAMKVGCYLAYQGIEYELIGVSPITFKQVEFADKRQIPVLKIGEEWKQESTDIGLWLEEKFPGSSLLGNTESEKAEILELDKWISDQLIPSMFRVVVDWPSTSIGFSNGWRLASAVNQSSPIPRWVRMMWPVFLRKAKFINDMIDTLDRSKPLQQSQISLIDDFVNLLDGGPFLGGKERPTLADLSAFPIIVFPYRFGLMGDAKWFENTRVVDWVDAVQQHLPANPFLVKNAQLPRELPAPASKSAA